MLEYQHVGRVATSGSVVELPNRMVQVTIANQLTRAINEKTR